MDDNRGDPLRGDDRSIPPVHLASEAPLAAAPSGHRRQAARKLEALVAVALVLGLVAWARTSVFESSSAARASAALPAWPALGSPALARAPDSTACEAEKQSARAALAEDRIEDAIAAGRRAVATDEGDDDAWRLLSDAYRRSGNDAEASRALASCKSMARRGSQRACLGLR
ncbi:MAG TPA: BTAD domain-containing putative transcriptional regulator [Labilithrix sp.]|nr:BTAD domain-containing putative transcriptional regulator [Labilithrix sp.]